MYNVLDKHSILEEKELRSLSNNLEFKLLFSIDFSKPFKDAKKDFIKNYLNDLLVLNLGNVSAAAKRAKLNRRHFHRMINELSLDPDTHRRDLIKPSVYLKDNVQNLLDETLVDIQEKEKVANVYSSINDISQVIVETFQDIPYEEAIELFEKEFITKTLQKFEYDLKKSAKFLEISERTLYRKLEKLGIVLT